MQWKDLKGLFLEMELIAVLGIVSKCPVEVASHTCCTLSTPILNQPEVLNASRYLNMNKTSNIRKNLSVIWSHYKDLSRLYVISHLVYVDTYARAGATCDCAPQSGHSRSICKWYVQCAVQRFMGQRCQVWR